ncbi:MAG: hypothetical protein JO002_04030 [Burkholderiaceae bacterium]|nr:hypothetical protein [Burkholderiaceae bacterium]
MKQVIASGALIAAAAAALALSGSASAAPAASGDDTVHCAGVNSCKGKGDCKTAENGCKGQNTCKGHGFLALKASECTAKGGKVIDAK